MLNGCKTIIFCHLIWAWLSLCLWLTFSSLLVPGASILRILDKLLKPWRCVFPIVFLHVFPRFWMCLGFFFFCCIFRRFVIFAVHSDFFFQCGFLLSFAFSLFPFMLLEVIFSFSLIFALTYLLRRFEAFVQMGKSPTCELLYDWGTTNCTVADLVDLLIRNQFLAPASLLLPGNCYSCTFRTVFLVF